MVRWYSGAHGILESTAQYINSFDTRGNGISFFAVKCGHARRWCSNRNYSPTRVQAESLDSAVSDFPTKSLALNAVNKNEKTT